MAIFSDLPPEIFAMVVDEIVATSGPCRALKLRPVCSISTHRASTSTAGTSLVLTPTENFNASILHSILARQPIPVLAITCSDHSDDPHKCLKVLCDNMCDYLSNRIANPKDTDPRVSALIVSMSNWIVWHYDMPESEERDAVQALVCKGVVQAANPMKLLSALWLQAYPELESRFMDKVEIDWYEELDDEELQLNAAICISAYPLVSKLLSRLDKQTPGVFGRPFDYAISKNDHAMVQMMVRTLEALPMNVQAAIDYDNWLVGAVQRAIQEHNMEILNDLIDVLNGRPAPPDLEAFDDCLHSAISTGSDTLLRAIFRIHVDEGLPKCSCWSFIKACEVGVLQILSTLFELGNLDPNHRWNDSPSSLFYPLSVALESEKPDVVKLVLEAGAEVNLFVRSNPDSPFQVANTPHEDESVNIVLDAVAENQGWYSIHPPFHPPSDLILHPSQWCSNGGTKQKEREKIIDLLLKYSATHANQSSIPDEATYYDSGKVSTSTEKAGIPSWELWRETDDSSARIHAILIAETDSK